MKNRIFFLAALLSVIICGTVLVTTVMATDCWELKMENCVTTDYCTKHCDPECGDVFYKSSYKVDKCKCKSTGYSVCEPDENEDVVCYKKASCQKGTITCPTDAARKECEGFGSYSYVMTKVNKLSQSGCTAY